MLQEGRSATTVRSERTPAGGSAPGEGELWFASASAGWAIDGLGRLLRFDGHAWSVDASFPLGVASDFAAVISAREGICSCVSAGSTSSACSTMNSPGSFRIGGMVSGGLSWTDVGDVRALGGFARRFYGAVAEHYDAALWAVKGPEPHVAERLLELRNEIASV